MYVRTSPTPYTPTAYNTNTDINFKTLLNSRPRRSPLQHRILPTHGTLLMRTSRPHFNIERKDSKTRTRRHNCRYVSYLKRSAGTGRILLRKVRSLRRNINSTSPLRHRTGRLKYGGLPWPRVIWPCSTNITWCYIPGYLHTKPHGVTYFNNYTPNHTVSHTSITTHQTTRCHILQ